MYVYNIYTIYIYVFHFKDQFARIMFTNQMVCGFSVNKLDFNSLFQDKGDLLKLSILESRDDTIVEYSYQGYTGIWLDGRRILRIEYVTYFGSTSKI